MLEQNRNFAYNLRKLRKEMGINQNELGYRLGISYMTVRRWEAGIRSPRIEDIKKICDVFNVTESELLNGPKNSKIKITLSWNREDVEGEIDMNGNSFALFLGTDGTLGIKGAANFTSRESLKEFIAAVAKELEDGFDFQVKRGKIKEGE